MRILLSPTKFKKYLNSLSTKAKYDVFQDFHLAEMRDKEQVRILLTDDLDEYFVDVNDINKKIVQSQFKTNYGKTLV